LLALKKLWRWSCFQDSDYCACRILNPVPGVEALNPVPEVEAPKGGAKLWIAKVGTVWEVELE
jgi:hypothetical protein